MRKNPSSAGHGRDGFYFVENFEYSGYEVAEETGKVLAELGIAGSAEPERYTKEECTQYFGVSNFLRSFVRTDPGWHRIGGRYYHPTVERRVSGPELWGGTLWTGRTPSLVASVLMSLTQSSLSRRCRLSLFTASVSLFSAVFLPGFRAWILTSSINEE